MRNFLGIHLPEFKHGQIYNANTTCCLTNKGSEEEVDN